MQLMIFAGSAGNSFAETVRSPLRPQSPGIPTEDGEMTFSIGSTIADDTRSGQDAPQPGARSQLRTGFWMDDMLPDATPSVSVTAGAETAEIAPVAPLDAERWLRQGPPLVDGSNPAISVDLPEQFDSGLPREARTETPPLDQSALPPDQPPGPFAIKVPQEPSKPSGKTTGGVHASTLPPAPPLAGIAASRSRPETGTVATPASIGPALAQGRPDDIAEMPAPRIEAPPGQATPRTTAATGQVPPQMFRPDAAAARPAPLGMQATVPDVSASLARGPALFVSDPTKESRLQDPRLSTATGNLVTPTPARGPETSFPDTQTPADRTERGSPAPFPVQPDQSKGLSSGIFPSRGNLEVPDNRHTAQGVGNDNSGLPDLLRAAKTGEASAIRDTQVSKESPYPATASSPTGMTRNADVSQTSRIPADGSGALITKAPAGEVMSAILSSADPSGHTASDVLLDTMDAGQPGQSGSGDTLRRTQETDIRITTLARGATAQIAEAVRLPLDGSIEVRLSPEELGRVRVSMIPGEAGLVIQLVAERPETLELLRRHADLLAADLHDAGYTGLEFSFSREDRGQDPSGAGSPPPPVPTVEQPATQAAVPEGIAGSDADGTLDLRL